MQNQHQVIPQHLGIKFHTLFHKNYMYYKTQTFFIIQVLIFFQTSKLKSTLMFEKQADITVFERKLCQIHRSSIVTLIVETLDSFTLLF